MPRCLAVYPGVRYLRLSRPFGRDTALRAGLDTAIGDYIVTLLPESDPPSLIPMLVAGLGLIEHEDSAAYPSEVYKLDWRTGKNQTVFRDKRYFITDVWLTRGGTCYLAGVEIAGQMHSIAPGNVKVFKSDDMSTWTEMAVDYRAVARRAILSGADEENLWLATDNGMILKLK